MNPDCRDGKHASCSGDGWDLEQDRPGPCPCECHQPAPATLAEWISSRAPQVIDIPSREELIADLSRLKTGGPR